MEDPSALREMIANLQAHIDQRAAELAAPLIAQAQEAAAIEVKGAQGMQQRAEDLITELRRHLTSLERQGLRYHERAEQAEAANARVLDRVATLTAWAHRELRRDHQALHYVLSVITNLRDALAVAVIDTEEADRG